MTRDPEQFAGGTLPGDGSNGGVSAVRVGNQFRAGNSGFFSFPLVFASLFGWTKVIFGLNLALLLRLTVQGGPG